MMSAAQNLAPLDIALMEQPEVVRQKAEAGDAVAQLAYAIVLDQGLHDTPSDHAGAMKWRARALQQRRMTPITQYTAAFNGQPSRVNIINMPIPVVSLGQVQALSACIERLQTGEALQNACGDEADAGRRARQWRLASSS